MERRNAVCQPTDFLEHLIIQQKLQQSKHCQECKRLMAYRYRRAKESFEEEKDYDSSWMTRVIYEAWIEGYPAKEKIYVKKDMRDEAELLETAWQRKLVSAPDLVAKMTIRWADRLAQLFTSCERPAWYCDADETFVGLKLIGDFA